MRTGFALLVAVWLANASAPTAAETMRFNITRNDEPIGTHTIEINRTGAETSVNISTDLAVNVLFFTAYRLQQRESERWLDDHLVALRSTSDNNGQRHKVAVATKGPDLELDVDGKTSKLDKDIVPASLWNPDFLRHAVVLDPQDGTVTSISVVDGGREALRLRGRAVQAHHYTVKGRRPQEVWYDDRGRLVRVKIIGSDGSVILFNPA
jgi:hypothetical protein